ncbi:MAG: phage protease [Balneolaceae bacterium]
MERFFFSPFFVRCSFQPNELINEMRQFLNKIFGDKNAKAKMYSNAVDVDSANDGWIKIIPIGEFPEHHNGGHEVTSDHIKEMVRNFKKQSTDILIDWDHESIWNSTKAAGWINKLKAKDDGLYVKYPEFTPTATEHIENREYRYFSPVYILESFDKKGKSVGAKFISCALTNTPYFNQNEIHAIGNRSTFGSHDNHEFRNLHQENDTTSMKLNKEALEALGLTEDATEEEINTAILNTNKQKEKPPKKEVEAPNTNSSEDEMPEWAKKLNQRFDEKEQSDAEAKVNALVEGAIASGKILPAQKNVYLNAAKADYEGTKTELDAMKVNGAVPGKLGIDPSKGSDVKVNKIEAATEHIAGLMGK